MARYVEIVMGRPSNRGCVVPVSEVSSWVKKARHHTMPLYRSYYLLDESALEHVKAHPSLKGYTGTYGIDRLLFDIDKGEDTNERTLDRVRGFLHLLTDDGWSLIPEHIQVWHSGGGYHVTIPDIFGFETSPVLPQVVNATLKAHFQEAGVDPIYDHARIIRVGGTVNPKTGRFKIPLTVREVFALSVKEVFEMARFPRENFRWPVALEPPPVYPDRIVLPHALERAVAVTPDGKLGEASRSTSEIVQSDPTTVATCMQRVYLDGEPEKFRHVLLQRLASVWRRQGLPLDAALTLAHKWCKTLEAAEVDRTVRYVWERGYRWGCDDEHMRRYCSPKCIYFKDKNLSLGVHPDGGAAFSKVTSIKDLAKAFEHFVTTDFSHTSFDLKDIFRLPSSYRFYPGEFITVMGDTGIGKTAFLQNVVARLEGMRTLYLSLEVADWLLFRRFVQIKHGLSKEQVNLVFQSQHSEKKERLLKGLSHLDVLTLPPTLQQVASLIEQHRPRVVVVDTLDGIEVRGVREELAKLERIGLGLKELAQQLGVIIFGVHHISKGAAVQLAEGGLNVHSGKGASTIEQKADKVIGVEGNRDMPARVVHSMKSRDESNFRIALRFHADSFRFTDVSQEELKGGL